jgi:hypothetical protein
MSLVPSHPCAALPYIDREQPTEPSMDDFTGKKESVVGRDVLPCLGMRVMLNESGCVWAKAYDKKFHTNYWDDRFDKEPLGEIVNVRKGCCTVKWDCGASDMASLATLYAALLVSEYTDTDIIRCGNHCTPPCQSARQS